MMPWRAGIVGVALCGAWTPGAAQTPGATTARPTVPPARPYVFPTVVRKTLPNGLRVAVLERHDLPLVVTRAVLAGGTVADPAGKEGVFALMRLAMNEGTATRPPDSLAARFADMGSSVSDSGFVTTTVNVDSSLAVLADLLMHPAFRPADVDRLRSARVTTVRAARTQGNLITLRVIAATLFGADHPFARYESEEGVGSITRDDLAAFHAAWVRPPNVSILLVGDITPAAAFARVERLFGAWPRGSGPTVAALGIDGRAIPRDPTAIYLVDAPLPNAYIRVASLSAPHASPDFPALDVMNAIYGDLTGSRLFRELRERRGVAYGTASSFQWRPTPAPSVFFTTLSSVAPANVDSAVSAVIAELRGIAGARPPSADEFAFGQGNRIASLPLQLETHERMARLLADIVREGLPPDFVTRYVAGIRSVTPAQLAAVAKRDVDVDHTAVVVVGDARTLEPKLRALNLAPVILVDDRGRRLR